MLLPLLIGSASAETFTGRVIGVTDGDTLTVLRAGRREVIRLNGIDAPEKGQAYGDRAKQFTAGLAFGQVVQVVVRDHDRYGRTVADVVLADGRSLSHEVVRAGYAWWFRRYSSDPRLAALEAEAQAARAGLWADRLPVPPWEWRRTMKARRVALERRRDTRSERRLSSTGRRGTSRRLLAGLPSPP